eukprot:CAMPEP_0113674538 /NCGR_PEP_ID=MMETSP0038_2-20120614/7474_1 /TAXON_ID=2898 /ORGANISM="Cryptomonas paramecium" /LENGTH=134 /DNA_ID=CAMNT_0000591129 /DNA_START=300 /DNA_END=704 /DNA_ORIENTATION=+ /assembly_acc=CAM_ASM_000170
MTCDEGPSICCDHSVIAAGSRVHVASKFSQHIETFNVGSLSQSTPSPGAATISIQYVQHEVPARCLEQNSDISSDEKVAHPTKVEVNPQPLLPTTSNVEANPGAHNPALVAKQSPPKACVDAEDDDDWELIPRS